MVYETFEEAREKLFRDLIMGRISVPEYFEKVEWLKFRSVVV